MARRRPCRARPRRRRWGRSARSGTPGGGLRVPSPPPVGRRGRAFSSGSAERAGGSVGPPRRAGRAPRLAALPARCAGRSRAPPGRALEPGTTPRPFPSFFGRDFLSRRPSGAIHAPSSRRAPLLQGHERRPAVVPGFRGGRGGGRAEGAGLPAARRATRPGAHDRRARRARSAPRRPRQEERDATMLDATPATGGTLPGAGVFGWALGGDVRGSWVDTRPTRRSASWPSSTRPTAAPPGCRRSVPPRPGLLHP